MLRSGSISDRGRSEGGAFMGDGKVGRKVTGGPAQISDTAPPAADQKDVSSTAAAQPQAAPLSAEDKAQLKGMSSFDGDIKKAALANIQGDLKAKIQAAGKSKLDGVEGLSKSEYDAIKNEYQTKGTSPENQKWLEKEHPHLYAALTSNLDYEGYVGTAVGSLNLTRSGDELKADAARRSQQLDKLPPTSDYREDGLTKNSPSGDPVATAEVGDKWKEYKTGKNTTYVKNDALAGISDNEAKQSREAQKDLCTKMSGIIGTDVSNPPSVNAAKGYFQALANRGASPEQVKDEYGKYLKTFYRHPGGVSWDPKLDPKNLDSQFKDQPLAKDGKRLIDCEGYAAMTQSVLGGLKKDGKPMFDIQHGAGPGHVFTGVFPHGGDPRKGFVVSNDQIQDVKWDSRMDKDYNASRDDQTRQRFVVREHWKQQFGEKSSTTDYGPDFGTMSPPAGKLPK